MRKATLSMVVAVSLLVAQPATLLAQDRPDLDAVYKIKEEGLGQRSQVMDILSYLTDVYGPRLTGSSNARQATDWAVKKMQEWGLTNVHTETWGPFGRGWVNERFSANIVSPTTYPLIAYPLAWTPGTNGPVTAEAALAVMETEADFEKYRGKLKGKIVLPQPMREVNMHTEPLARRYTDAELAEIAEQPVAGAPGAAITPAQIAQRRAATEFANKRARFLYEEGVAAVFEPGRGDDGTVFVQSGGSRDPKEPPAPPRVMLDIEHYGRILRTLQKGVGVTVELNIQNRFLDADLNSFNIVGEIPGTDKADEVVMVGAHFDSWHSGTGATDNGAGSAVMMEVMRILKATGLKLRRTVRIGLWTGEEQGLLGSRAYVKEHLGDRETPDQKTGLVTIKSAHAKFDAYFNIDNGSGKIRGIYLQGNEAVAPIFAAWMEPFRNLGMTTLSIRNTGGTDHLSFDAVGLPGFQFIQDPLEYDSRTHHSNMDVYERAQPADMKQIATIVAAFVYMTANREQMLPRKPLPKPQRPGGGGGGPRP